MRILVLALWVTLAGMVPSPPLQGTGATLDVEVTYEGEGPVDPRHPVVVLLFDGPPGGGGRVVAARWVVDNGALARFESVPADSVYLLAIYDERAALSGLSIPAGSPMTVWTAGSASPAEVALPASETVRVRFGDAMRYPGDSTAGEPLDALAAADGIVEIRTYTVEPGRREEFIAFFENQTLGPQGEAGVRVIGQFRSLEDPDVFVWMRAFRSQRERVTATRAFYLGPTWLEELSPTAADLIVSTSVTLLEPTARSQTR